MKKTTAIIGISAWVVLLFCLFITISSASAAEVTMAINPNSTTDPAGYKLYWGKESGQYTSAQSLDLGARVRDVPFTVTIGEIVPGNTYYFAATAYDASGNESEYSNEVSKTVPLMSPTLKNLTITMTVVVQ